MNAITTTIPVPVTESGMAIWDYERRTYLRLNRAGTAWHIVRPATEHDQTVRDGKVQAGELTCVGCPGGLNKGRCYVSAEAEAYEAWMADEAFWGTSVAADAQPELQVVLS